MKALKRLALILIIAGPCVICILVLGVGMDHKFKTLPYYTSERIADTVEANGHRIGTFEFVNQNSQKFGSKDLLGSVWIAAFFSTGGEHAVNATKQLLWPNFRYRDVEGINIVCFSLDPEHDTPEVLKEYVNLTTRYNGIDDKWQFLTGEKSAIDNCIADQFLIKRDPEDPDNISTLLLIDKDGYIRGIYFATSENALRDATEDIALLRKEMDNEEYRLRKLYEDIDSQNESRPTPPVLGIPGHTVPPFAFLSIDSIEVTNRDVEGKIKIVDYFFTHCPTICPILSSQLARTQEILADRGITNEDLIILSHSVDPTRDTPNRIDEYAKMMNADTTQWKFLTGNKEDLYEQAKEGYLLTALESDTAAGGFFHSDIFALIDKEDKIRGMYDGTSTAEVDEMILDIHKLLDE